MSATANGPRYDLDRGGAGSEVGEASATDPGGWAGSAADEAVYPSGHVDASGEVLTSAHAQARQRAEAGDLTGARTLLEEALAAGELQLGRDHPRLAPLMVDLATIARNVGNLTEAQNQLRRAYGIVVSSAGPEHATALSIEGRLAAVNYRLGEPTEAYDWHIADVGARVLGTEHPAVRGAQQRLAAAPVHEEPTPPTDPPYEQYGSDWVADEYVPSSEHPGVYQRTPTSDDLYVVEPPPRAYPTVEVWPEPPVATRVARRRGHAGGITLVASVGLAILIASVVIAMQLFGGAGAPIAQSPAGPSPVTTVGSPSAGPAVTPSESTGSSALAPTGLRLQDNVGSVTLTWTDPSGGRVPFIVAGSRAGNASAPMATVPAGHTTSTIVGLNSHYNYCFTVAAVWSADVIQPSTLTCTKRKVTAGQA